MIDKVQSLSVLFTIWVFTYDSTENQNEQIHIIYSQTSDQ